MGPSVPEVGVAFRLLLAGLAAALAFLAGGPRVRRAGLLPLLVLPLTGDARWVFAAGALGVFVPSVLALDATPPPRRATWTLAFGLLAFGALAFTWLLPFLPAVTRRFAPWLGHARYGSPSRLWVALAVGAPLALALARAPAALARAGRPRLARRVEVALVLSLAALVLAWLGAALGTLPRFAALAPRTATLAGALGALGWLFVLPALRRPCADAAPSGE